MAYQIGDKVRITVTCKNVTRVISDPDTLRFRFRKPDGTETVWTFGVDAQVVREAVGVFHVDLPLTMASVLTKEWRYRWEAEGTFSAAYEKPLQVDDTGFNDVVQF